jgi:N-acetyl-anhydromuramyl-L-alanine amidase AmpD
MPWFPVQPSDKANTILIMGERHELSSPAIEVHTYDRGGEPTFYEVMGGLPVYGNRYEKPGVPVKTLEQLRAVVTQIILHTDLTPDALGCFRALVGRQLSSHFLLNYDGVLYQPLDVMDCGYHAGEGNNASIGIDLNNELPNLVREPSAPPYSGPNGAELQRTYPRPISERMEVNGAKVQSYGYTDAQYTTLIELFKVLTRQLDKIQVQFPVDPKGEVVGRTLDAPVDHRGFMAHWHWELQRWDPGPGFDWQRVFHALGNEHNAFPVELEALKNIKTLLEPDKVKAYAERYFANNETQTDGWYPMGINQTWHGGIHLAAPRGTNVYAMTDGVVVAARFGRESTKLGSNNFVLLKHRVPIPTTKPEAEPKTFVFYSLYMHLDCIDTVTLKDPEIAWLSELTRVEFGREAEAAVPVVPADPNAPAEREEAADGNPCDAISKAAWLDVGHHAAALKRGMVAKIAYRDEPIYVLAGQTLGRVGMFGAEGEWKAQVHVEVFADAGWKEAIDIGVHGRHLVELDDDVGDNLFVEDRAITALFGDARRPAGLVPEHTLDQATIEAFWQDPSSYLEEKRYLRKLVTRHVSEWSDQVDWITSLSKASDWDGKVADFRKILKGSAISNDAIATVLPFTWLSKDVAEHIGLDTKDWRGQLDHFHPIHFLMWLTFHSTQRVQVLSSNKLTPKELRRRAAAARDEAERCRVSYPDRRTAEAKMNAGDADAAKCFGHLTDEDRNASLSEAPPDDVAYVGLGDWLQGRDQGDWQRAAASDD